MSLWCPYIKANYCFLWSCNKYILRHPVAKGADCVQERTRKHVFLVTGKGPRQHRVSQPGIPQLSLRPLLLHQSEERGKGLAPFLGTAPQTKRLKAGFVVGDQKSHGCSSLCQSYQWITNSDGFHSPCSVCSWAMGLQTSWGYHSKAPSLSWVSLNVCTLRQVVRIRKKLAC